MSVDWAMISALALVVSGIAVVGSLLLVQSQLRQQAKEQFVSGTADLYSIWEDDDFQRAMQWVLYDLSEQTWRSFVAKHRGEYGERAFNRVGGYFTRVGYLVTRHLLGNQDRLLLDVVAGPAIAVWQKIEPLVLEARLIEDATIFQDYQRMLPECYECYVPNHPVPARILEGAAHAARLSGER